eukprot:g3280.t1
MPADGYRVPIPSIPHKEVQLGYEETKLGRLVPQKPDVTGHTGVKGDTIGPGRYYSNRRRKNRDIRAVAFGRSRTKRVDFARKHAPGPGRYEVPVSVAGTISPLLRKKPSASFMSNSARSTFGKSSQNKNIPGPGIYKIKSTFRSSAAPKPSHLQFFGSTKRRFDDTPLLAKAHLGPGSYCLKSSTFGTKNPSAIPVSASRYVGFDSSKMRFERSKVTCEDPNAPAPNAYTHPGFADSILKQDASDAYKTKMPFGASSRRFSGIKMSDLPGPGAYTQSPTSATFVDHPGTSVLGSSGFVSESTRADFSRVGDGPDPTEYDVNTKWVDDIAKGRRDVIGKGKDRFASSQSKRFVPGPGAYDVDGCKPWHGHTFSVRGTVGLANRFAKGSAIPSPSPSPGPGSYDPEMPYGNLNTRTFNISIAEEMCV